MSEETSQTNNEIPKNTENISNQIKTLEDQNQSTTDLEKQNLNPQPKILINQLDKPNKKNNPYLLKNKAILVSDLGSDFQDDEKNDYSFHLPIFPYSLQLIYNRLLQNPYLYHTYYYTFYKYIKNYNVNV